MPAVVAADGSLPALLFGSLGGEDAGARTSLQEALAALADVHADGGALAASKGATLRPLLLRAAGSASPHERLCAMVWAGRVFPSDDVPSRYACVLGAGDARPEVREAAFKSLRPPAKPTAAAATGDGDDSGTLEPGQRVTYTAADGSARPAVVAKVHWDDGETPYYTIALAAGGERSTERSRLRKRAVGLPPLRSMVGQLLKGVPREAADAALTAAGAPADGRWADGGGAEAAPPRAPRRGRAVCDRLPESGSGRRGR